MAPSHAALDLSFIEPASTVFDKVKEAVKPEMEKFTAIALTGTGSAILIRSLTGGR